MIEQKWTDEVRAEALRLADEIGAAEAGDQTGVPAATIRWWQLRERERAADAALVDDDEPGSPVDFTTPAAASERLSQSAARTLEKLERFVAAGKVREAKDAGITLGILLDKATALARAAAEVEARQAALSERQGEQIASVIRGVIADLHLPDELKRAVPPLVRRHIEALGGGVHGYEPLEAEINSLLEQFRADAVDDATKVAVDERTRRIKELRDEIVARQELSGAARAAVDELVERTEADRPAVDVDAVDVSRPSSFDELDDDDVDRGDDLSAPPGADGAAVGGDAPSGTEIGGEAGRERPAAGRERPAAGVSRRRRSPADQLLRASPDSRSFKPEPVRPAGWETRLPRDGLAPERPGGDAA